MNNCQIIPTNETLTHTSQCPPSSPCCKFIDMNGHSCSNPGIYNKLCKQHYLIEQELKEYHVWKRAVEFHDKHEYTGEHWEKCDEYGPIPIYHYSRKKPESQDGNDNWKRDDWVYDEEIWIGDELWNFCGLDVKMDMTRYPEDFEEQLKLKALVN